MNPFEPTPDQLVSVRNVALLREIIPIMEAEVGKFEKALENRVFTALQQGTLSPQSALEAWMEKAAYRKLVRNLYQKAAIGQTVGETVAKALDG